MRQPLFQFTLRESLFGVTALGAILALCLVQFGRYTTTTFFKSFDGATAIRSICNERNITVQINSSQGGGWQGSAPATRAMRYTLETPEGTESAIIDDLEVEIRAQLKQAGARVRSGGSSRGSATGGPDFKSGYRLGKTEGFVGVYSLANGEGGWKLLILVHEFPNSP